MKQTFAEWELNPESDQGKKNFHEANYAEWDSNPGVGRPKFDVGFGV